MATATSCAGPPFTFISGMRARHLDAAACVDGVNFWLLRECFFLTQLTSGMLREQSVLRASCASQACGVETPHRASLGTPHATYGEIVAPQTLSRITVYRSTVSRVIKDQTPRSGCVRAVTALSENTPCNMGCNMDGCTPCTTLHAGPHVAWRVL